MPDKAAAPDGQAGIYVHDSIINLPEFQVWLLDSRLTIASPDDMPAQSIKKFTLIANGQHYPFVIDRSHDALASDRITIKPDDKSLSYFLLAQKYNLSDITLVLPMFKGIGFQEGDSVIQIMGRTEVDGEPYPGMDEGEFYEWAIELFKPSHVVVTLTDASETGSPEQYRKSRRQGLSPQEAASEIWEASILVKQGYSHIASFSELEDDDGELERIWILFARE
ncbi:MAG TPA: hypothetical protein ENI23_14375 [bacterium]|nr:hypothetical protein [bacterium]